jgi:hypothetical protein
MINAIRYDMNHLLPNHNIEIDQLATYIFLQNTSNNLIYLDIQGIENRKDAFCMCLDIFLKGFVLLYGTDGRLEVDTITHDAFRIICDRMRLAGISPKLNMSPLDDEDNNMQPAADILRKSVYMLYTKPDNLPMQDYHFTLKIGENVCTVSFEFIRI